MAKKLIKVAKHFNIGLSTVVDFLNGKGFDIESKPTAKVTDEMYGILSSEFSTSAEVKEEADKLTMGNKQEKQQEIPEVKPVPEPDPTPSPTVVETVPEELPVVEPTKEDITTKVVEETPVAEEKSEPVTAPEPTPQQPESKSTEDTSVEKVVEESAPVEPEPIKTEESKERSSSYGLKIKGKIDLDQFNKKPKKKEKPAIKSKPLEKPTPKKKDQPKKSKQVSDTKQSPKEKSVFREGMKKTVIIDEDGAAINTGHIAEKEDIVRASTPTLSGLKIKGKIDISKLEKKPKTKKVDKGEKGNSSNAKKKRTRTIRKVYRSGGTGGASRNRNDRYKKKGGKGQKPEVKELTKKEIEAQIKATMARLSGGGKNKRQKIRREIRETKKEKQEQLELENVETTLKLTEFITVAELASLMEVGPTDVITTCMNLGVFVSINQRLDAEIIELVAGEYDHEVEFISAEETTIEEEEDELDDPKDLVPRAPIVTIMGHVDHGKTSLLDYIREANVADGEAGGITQHIGAYKVSTEVAGEQREITFLDTPGHEAFTAMRARGAKVTDIAVIIIAADDKIMPQTKEAISHAQAAGVPIVFAINKIDKDGASPERIKQELASANLLIEEWGGKFQSQDISAKMGINIDLLLEKIILEADMLELKANPNARAKGSIIEAALDKGKGYTAKVLVKNGTLKIGDPMSVGKYYGKVKALIDGHGKRIKSAGPSTPVMILGLNGAPQAGEVLKVYSNEQDAKAISQRREQLSREQSLRTTKRISLEEIGRRLALGTFKELNLIIKGDMDGSVEALTDSLQKLSVETVTVNVIHKAVGAIIESDVLLAAASDAIIIGFQVRPSAGVRNIAEKEEVQIKTYSIIYEAIEDITDAIEGMLEPTREEKILGQMRVQEVYKISKVGTIAGCLVEEGTIIRSAHIRLIREGIVVYPTKEGVVGEMSSLKRYKDDVKEVKSGMECGLSIKNYNDIKVDDTIEVYEIIEIQQKLKRKR